MLVLIAKDFTLLLSIFARVTPVEIYSGPVLYRNCVFSWVVVKKGWFSGCSLLVSHNPEFASRKTFIEGKRNSDIVAREASISNILTTRSTNWEHI